MIYSFLSLPFWPDLDPHFFADPDPDRAKTCGSVLIRIRIRNPAYISCFLSLSWLPFSPLLVMLPLPYLTYYLSFAWLPTTPVLTSLLLPDLCTTSPHMLPHLFPTDYLSYLSFIWHATSSLPDFLALLPFTPTWHQGISYLTFNFSFTWPLLS